MTKKKITKPTAPFLPEPPDYPPGDAMGAFVNDPFLDVIDVDSQGNAFDINDNPIPPRATKKKRTKKGPS